MLLFAILYTIKKREKGIPAHEVYSIFRKLREDIDTFQFQYFLTRLNTVGVIVLKTSKRDTLFGLRIYKTIENGEFEEMIRLNERLKETYEIVSKVLKNER